MAVLWCDVFVLISQIIIKRNGFISYGAMPLIAVLLLGITRLVFSIEFPFTKVIRSYTVYNKLHDFATAKLFGLSSIGLTVTVGYMLAFIWIFISIALLLRCLYDLKKESNIIASFRITRDEEAEELLKSATGNGRQSGKVRVYRTDDIIIPFITGIINPTIYLPKMDFSKLELKAILAHEWSHYRHKDNLIYRIIDVICIVFWWNPVIYLLKLNLRHTMEIRCDQDVKANISEKERKVYLKCLLRIADICDIASTASLNFTSLISINEGKKMEQRFDIMLENSEKRFRHKATMVAFFTVMLVLFAASFTFVYQPYIGRENPTVYYSGDSDIDDAPDSWVILADGELNSNYIVDNKDGTYSIYVRGEFYKTVDDISNPPYLDFPIIENDKQEEKP